MGSCALGLMVSAKATRILCGGRGPPGCSTASSAVLRTPEERPARSPAKAFVVVRASPIESLRGFDLLECGLFPPL